MDIKNKIYYFFTFADCTFAKIFLAISSLLWALILFLPGNTFDWAPYSLMKEIASEFWWGVAHLIYGTLIIYTLTHANHSKIIGMIESVIGFLIWTTSAICMLIAVYPISAAISPHIVGALATWWVLIRTDLTNG